MDEAEFNPTEGLFDRYCEAMGYRSAPIPTSDTPTADRMVETPAGRVVVEVKGYGFSKADRALTEELTERHHRITLGQLGRERLDNIIRRARRQVDRLEYEGLPRVLVVGRHPYVDTGPFAILSIMYGQPFISIPIGPDGPVGEPETRFPTPMRGRLHHAQGPVSAVAVIDEVFPDAAVFERLLHEENERIRREERELERRAEIVRFLELSDRVLGEHPELDLKKQVPRLRVHENANAAVVLPRAIFWGPHDRRWGPVGEEYQEIGRP